MNKNIRQNFFLQVKKLLEKVDNAGDLANHFRGVVLIDDANENSAFSWIHAPKEDIKNLILSAFHNDDVFLLATAEAFEAYDKELREKEQSKQ